MDISTLWKPQTCEQHSLISYSKKRMQTEGENRVLRGMSGAKWKEVAGGSREEFN